MIVGAVVYVNGVEVARSISANTISGHPLVYVGVNTTIYVKAGDVITTRSDYGVYNLTVYGLKSATPSN